MNVDKKVSYSEKVLISIVIGKTLWKDYFIYFQIIHFCKNEREIIYIEKRFWKDLKCKITSLELL